ncbi:hypothetical protein [Pedobacter sp.]|uniref:hypothetical protein n=1 Tax=Pedobacter sp. TaxID=1411316 RepID=UPI0031D2D7FD
MKTTFTISIILISAQIVFAQENKLKLSLGAGMANASSENKAMGMGNGLNVQADAFVPFYSKVGNFALGLNVLGNYATLKNPSPDNALVADQYQIYGGNLSVISQKGAASSSFSGMLGIQASFSFGKINISPSLNSGYLRVKQNGFVQTGSATINGQNQQLALVKSEAQSTSGLAFKPQLKVGYAINPNLSLFISPAMWLGPEMSHTTSQRVPQGGFNDKKMYEASQLANGSWEHKVSTSRYNFTELNFGLALSIGKTKGSKGGSGAASASYAKGVANSGNTTMAQDSATTANRLSMTPTSTRQTPNTSFGAKVQSNETVNPVYEDKGIKGVNPMFEQKSIQSDVTVKQTQGKTFGEKVASGLQSGGNAIGQGASLLGGAMPQGKSISEKGVKRSDAMAKPGTPIGGIVVKGGKNPGGNMILVSNNNGEVLLDNLEIGSYAFQMTSPAQPAGKSISSKGVKRTAEAMAKPGNPIGGIIVKGGKNPGGNYIILPTDGNGKVDFEVLEQGNYKLIVEEAMPQTNKSISSKGVKRSASRRKVEVLKSNKTAATSTNINAKEVRTYTGGRKNEPQGKSISEKGVAGPKPKAKPKAQVKEKATTGLKDVVKTQV